MKDFFAVASLEALNLAKWGTSGKDIEELAFWAEHATSQDEVSRELAEFILQRIQERTLDALAALDAGYFERLALIMRKIKAAQAHDFADPMAAILLASYGVAGIETRIKEGRDLPFLRELLDECEKCESWPKAETETQKASRDKLAEKVARQELKLEFAPAKRGPKVRDLDALPLLTRKEVCFHRRIDRSTLWRWERLGLTFVGGRITEAGLDDWLRKRDAGRRLNGR